MTPRPPIAPLATALLAAVLLACHAIAAGQQGSESVDPDSSPVALSGATATSQEVHGTSTGRVGGRPAPITTAAAWPDDTRVVDPSGNSGADAHRHSKSAGPWLNGGHGWKLTRYDTGSFYERAGRALRLAQAQTDSGASAEIPDHHVSGARAGAGPASRQLYAQHGAGATASPGFSAAWGSGEAPRPRLLLAQSLFGEATWSRPDHIACYHVYRKQARFQRRHWVAVMRRYSHALHGKTARSRELLRYPWGDVPGKGKRFNRRWAKLRRLAVELIAGGHPDPCPEAIHFGGTIDVPWQGLVPVECGETSNTFYALEGR